MTFFSLLLLLKRTSIVRKLIILKYNYCSKSPWEDNLVENPKCNNRTQYAKLGQFSKKYIEKSLMAPYKVFDFLLYSNKYGGELSLITECNMSNNNITMSKILLKILK